MKIDRVNGRDLFRIHFWDAERHPLEIHAVSPESAREIANAQGYSDGQIKKIKVVKEMAHG